MGKETRIKWGGERKGKGKGKRENAQGENEGQGKERRGENMGEERGGKEGKINRLYCVFNFFAVLLVHTKRLL